MSRKKVIDFPEIGNISTLDYYELLLSGKRATRHSTQRAPVAGAIVPPKAIPQKQPKKKPKKDNSSPYKKKKTDEVVPPSPPEETVKLKFLYGTVWGEGAVRRKVYIEDSSGIRSGCIEAYEEVKGEDMLPVRYLVSGTWIDLREVKAYLTGEIVEFEGQEFEVLWAFPPPLSLPEVTLYSPENSTPEYPLKIVNFSDLRQARFPLDISNWVIENREIEVSDSTVHKFYFRFLTTKTSRQKILILRKHEATGKYFVYKDKQFRWINPDKATFYCNKTEPPIPFNILSTFSPGQNLRKLYKNYFLQCEVSFPKISQEDKQFRKQTRCKLCDYILDVLEYKQCENCQSCFHSQCLDPISCKAGFRNLWRCPDCPRCENCLGVSDKLLRCVDCNNHFHERCVDPNVLPTPAKFWRCELCAQCTHCKIRATEACVKWNENITKCTSCDSKWKKNEYCAICEKFWFSKKGRQSRTEQRLSQNDDPEMIECDKCKMWVHLACEVDMTTDMWAQFTADKNMKYYCPKCNKERQNNETLAVIYQLIDLEKNRYFCKKIEDPYYQKVIKCPMFFDMMLENAKEGMYFNSPQLLKDHFALICENAMHYLKANTDGYKAAKKLLDDGFVLLDSKFLPIKRKKSSIPPVSKKFKYENDLENFNLDLPSSLDTPVFYDFSLDLLSSLPPVNFYPSLTIIINKCDIQPFMGPKPLLSFYPMPLPISYTDPLLCLLDQCYICSAFIQSPSALVCRTCSRAFHSFCIVQAPVSNAASWRCKDCRVCEICNSTQDALSIIYCKKCEKGYDVQCLWPNIKGGLYLKDWVCDKCFKCSRCECKTYHLPGFSPNRDDFFSDFSLCFKCKWVVVNKDYCPECEKEWRTPYDQEVFQCDKVLCKSCEFYFHIDCTQDWKGVCNKCFDNTLKYSQIEQGTLEKVQSLMDLMNQSKAYQILAQHCIEYRYKLKPELATLLANFFLVDNHEFLTTNPDIKNFFVSLGFEITRKVTKRKPNYDNTRVPRKEGLRASEIPTPRNPLVRMHRPKDLLHLWNIEWDTSSLILSLNKILTPLDNIEVIELFFTAKEPEQRLLLFVSDFIWDFESISEYMDLQKDPSLCLIQRYEWLTSTVKEISPIVDETLYDEKSESVKFGDICHDVMVKEYSHEQMIMQYVKHELPAAVAFINQFEIWLREHLLDITQHIINSDKREMLDSTNFTDFEIKDENVENDLTKGLQCVLCKEFGEKTISGRLLPCEEALWVHANCAYWSAEVRNDEAGNLLNFNLSLSRGKKNKCKECGKAGATLNCIGKKCHNSYHFPCALACKVVFLDNKVTICDSCGPPKDTSRILSIESLSSIQHERIVILRSKKTPKKPNLVTGSYNRIGSIMLYDASERFCSYRLALVNGTRKILKCEKKDGFFTISECCNFPDRSTSILFESRESIKTCLSTGTEIFRSSELEDLWAYLKRGESFVLKSAADFYGFPLVSLFSPLLTSGELFNTVKENKTILEKIASIKPSAYGSSKLEPFTKHKAQHKIPKSHINQKSVGYEEQAEVKNETILVSEYRKYKKTIDRDCYLEVVPSNIHGLGLFTTKDISPGKIVVEYIGEIIRNRVADMREKEYELKGIGQGSCYLFRLDEEHVIDATVKGGKARFINHSCQPNCAASVCDIEGDKHILLFAKRFIHKGEEITYDYNFEVEEDKISCQCGSKDCQGKLN